MWKVYRQSKSSYSSPIGISRNSASFTRTGFSVEGSGHRNDTHRGSRLGAAICSALVGLVGSGLVVAGSAFWAARRAKVELYQLPVRQPLPAKELFTHRHPDLELAHNELTNGEELGTRIEKTQLTILHLSDLHLWSGRKWLIRYCQKLARLQPDLVVLSGDNFSDPSGLPALKAALTPLTAFPGVFVWGSNDFYSGVFKLPIHYFLPRRPPRKRRQPDLPTFEFGEWLGQAGWIDLNNRVASLRVNGKLLAFSGVEDPHINRDRPVSFPPDWERADLRIALTHAPYARVVNAYASAGADLVLAGHTHGGQICRPGRRALTNNTDLPLEHSQGVFAWDRSHPLPMRPATPAGKPQPLPDLKALQERFQSCIKNAAGQAAPTWVGITPGLGTSKFVPFRLFCPPRAHLYKINASGPETL